VLVWFLKDHARLTSPLPVAAALVAMAVWLLARPSSRAPKRALLVLALGYWLVSTPLGSGMLAAGLTRGVTSLPTKASAMGADTVVVLGGGASTYREAGAVVGVLLPGSVLRALEGARVARLIDARLVIASGGEPREYQLEPESRMIRDALVQTGVPADRILEEAESKTTRDEAVVLRGILAARGVTRFVLVTSPLHMRRSLATFRAEGLDPVPSASPMSSDNAIPPPLLLPNEYSLSTSSLALYEYAATVYYWLNGWTHAPSVR
jgi:uncharacterized SAM-binding protein YcdF (DUF218 family)